jgi:eukaryotic-like serine/threonine-protein kinase
MRPEQAERVAEIVEEALESSADKRRRLIVDLCGDDADLRTEVDSLLRFQEKAFSFIEIPAFELAAKIIANENGKLKSGEQLGDYKIVSLLGEVESGEVYLAEDTTLNRKVAIKLLRSGFGAGGNTIRRFRQEEQNLAGLTHPNIAWLYRGAMTTTGIPYFVMEYADGPRLDHYCRDKALSIRERLVLFRKVCAAVSYAHQRLVIHRNIKPANIRINADGEPKLLDFGIAKPLDPAISIIEQTIIVAAGITSEYASPEQVRGETITTASDIYSLGVVLYELLTEQHPYCVAGRRPGEVARAIAEQQPAKPSIAINLAKRESRIENRESSGSRFTASPCSTQRRLTHDSRLLRGDLDHIILKALRKQPEHRYASVAQFSEDIHRYLVGLPVLAGRHSVGYRIGKFLKRHPVGIAAAALFTLTLIGGIIATAGLARRADQQRELAERRFNDFRQEANSLMSGIQDSAKNLPSLQRELASVYETLGDIQRNAPSANLGDTNGALASYRKAMGIREGLGDVQASTETQIEIARSYRALGDILAQKEDISGTVDNYRNSLAILEKLNVAPLDNISLQDELARTYETLGDALQSQPPSGERVKAYRDALSIRQRLLAQKPDDANLQRAVGLNLLKAGSATDPKIPEAPENIRRGISMLEALSAKDPNNARADRDVAYGYCQLGRVLMGAGDLAGALLSRDKAFDIRQRIAGQYPKNAETEFDLAVAEGDLSEVLIATGDSSKAKDHAQQSLSILLQLSAADPTNVVYRRNIGLCYEKLGDALAGLPSNKKQSRSRRAKNWTNIRTAYQEGLNIFAALRDQGKLMPVDSRLPDQFAAKIAECHKALNDLKR